MRHSHESSVSAVSLTLVGVIACSLFLLAGTPELRTLPRNAEPAPQSAAAPIDASYAGPGSPSAAREARRSDGAPRVVDLIPVPESAPPADERLAELDMRFRQAAMMLHAQRFGDAMVALHRVLQLSPRLPEAHANMGYALLGLEDYRGAHDFFMTAVDLDPYLGNAYWGLAVALEKLGDVEGALGAMRTYIHLAPADDPYVRRARSALWEWDTRLARGPLPEHEAEWIERNTRAWIERNLPDRDGEARGEITIPVRDIR